MHISRILNLSLLAAPLVLCVSAFTTPSVPILPYTSYRCVQRSKGREFLTLPETYGSGGSYNMAMVIPGSTAVGSVGRAGAALAASVALRGGGIVYAPSPVTNVLPGVLAELANIRTPAALLGGAALGTMFIGLKPGSNNRLKLLYTTLATWGFALQLVCVLSSTLTYTHVASMGQAMAPSAISFLKSDLEFEFYVIRGSFVYGLFSFLSALIARSWLTFNGEGERGIAVAVTGILGTSILFLLNYLDYLHSTLTLCLGGMTKRMLYLAYKNLFNPKRFFRHITWIAMVSFLVWALRLGPNQEN